MRVFIRWDDPYVIVDIETPDDDDPFEFLPNAEINKELFDRFNRAKKHLEMIRAELEAKVRAHADNSAD